MININGKVYSNFNTIPSDIIRAFFMDPVFDFKLRLENNQIIFWEEHYFMMMAQLRRLRLAIPMNFTLEYFIEEINKLTAHMNEKSFIVDIKFANDYKSDFNNFEPNLVTAIFVTKTKSLINDRVLSINEMSLFKDYNLTDQEFGSISYLQKDIKRIASIESYENNYDDVIILNNKKNIIGSVMGNIFLFQNGKIICPSTNIGRESSVISDLFIEFLKFNKIDFFYESFGVFELQIADEFAVLSIENGLNPVKKYRKKIYESDRLPNLFKSFLKSSLV
jgi:branched-chain amino acid aminotransferase